MDRKISRSPIPSAARGQEGGAVSCSVICASSAAMRLSANPRVVLGGREAFGEAITLDRQSPGFALQGDAEGFLGVERAFMPGRLQRVALVLVRLRSQSAGS